MLLAWKHFSAVATDNQVVVFLLLCPHAKHPNVIMKLNKWQERKIEASISVFAPTNYRTDDVAILRSFVICQAALTLQ